MLGRDLHGANLRNSDFAEANLRGADLSEADLYNADFSGANLDGVNLQNANLKGARFVGASLVKADLRGARLADTDLRGANLSETNFTQTDLTQVYLQGVTFDGAKLVEADLRRKNLAGVILTGADLTSADLSEADLSGSRLSRANLSGARLRGTNLAGSWLNLTNLAGADLAGGNLAGASLIGANLASVNLSSSRLVGAILIGAHVNGANLAAADLSGVRLLVSELIPIDLLTDPNLQELNELQLLQVIADVDLAGVRFNRQTKWPIGNTSTLATMIGEEYYDYTSTAATIDADTPGPTTPPIAVVGSPTLMPLTQMILMAFAQAGYTQTVFLDSINTGAAFAALCEEQNADIVMSHRPISEEETDTCTANGRQPSQLTVGRQALVLVANPQNTFLNDVSLADLNALAVAGRWSDVNLDWPREEIARYVPDVESVSLEFWAEHLFGADINDVEDASRTIPSANGAQLIQGVVNDPYAIGIFDYALYQQNASALKLLSLNGVAPSAKTVNSGAYTLTQTLYLYVDAISLSEAPHLREFVDFYLDTVAEVAEDVGLFPASVAVPEQVEQEKREKRWRPSPIGPS
ncbi:MAG: pentapeptide repeat-containing protein [Caldilineaceae bacterium]